MNVHTTFETWDDTLYEVNRHLNDSEENRQTQGKVII